MKTFSQIVTNFSIGAISKSRVAFYAKRLSKETATRRIASVLMIGLLVLQFVTFIAPPKASYASNANDLVAGGPFSKEQLISTVWNNNPAGIQQVFNRLQINQAKMQAAPVGQACMNQGWLSMGRTRLSSSDVEFQQNIFLGPATSRWNQACLQSIIGQEKIYDSVTGKWYEWGVILDCGNIILRETTPPITTVIKCQALNTNNAGPVAVGTSVNYRGTATGTGLSAADRVDMAYAVYDSSNTLAFPIQNAQGIGQDPANTFRDPTARPFTFTKAGTYSIRLLVGYVENGTRRFAEGSAVGACAKQITVSAPKSLVCESLTMARNTGQAPFTPALTGKAKVNGTFGTDPTPSRYQYTLYREQTGSPAGGSNITFNNKVFVPVPNKVINRPNTTLQDPALPATTFNAPEFAQSAPGSFLIVLRVFDQAGAVVPDNTACYQPFSVTAQPKDFTCVKLEANPSSGTGVPFATTLSAQASVLNTGVKEYQFDFGDGAKQTIPSDKLTQSTQHTYTKGGKYTAKVTVVATDNTTSTKNVCTTPITIEQQDYQKTVKNLTLLTSDGKPTDANNQTARAGDKLTYTIGVANIGASAVKGFVFRDNISDILEYATVTDLGGAKVEQKDGLTFLVWPAMDIPVSTGTPSVYTTKSFTVQIKNPIPASASKPTDTINFDCKIQDEFFGKLVVTPLYINPAKQVECALPNIPLPRTGSEAIPIAVISIFAASSVYLLFRNRLLKRELELVEVLNEKPEVDNG